MGFWRSAAATKKLATGLLALALAAIAATYAANQRSVAIQGPGALQAVSDRTAWLGVDQELWILDRDGHRTGVRTARELGLSEAVSNIVLAPDGQALLTSRGDPHWQVVNRTTLAPVRTIRPQWPPGFADHYLRAIHLAMAPDGDIAVATGGGDAVLLFDREGRFKARSAPSTYRFTNGIWWSPEGWWTTDTNRFALRVLDAGTLAAKAAVPLAAEPAGYPFLGEAQASQGRPRPGRPQAPLATLTRLGSRMEPGHAVDVFPDGTQVLFNQHPIAQLRDITWFDGRLLVVDGATFTVHRFGPDRVADGLFGDARVQAQLRQLHADREFWRTVGARYSFLLAALLLIAGIGAYARHKRLAALEVVATREGGTTAAVAAPLRELARQRTRIFGVALGVRVGAVLVAVLVVFPLLHHALLGPRPDRLAHSLVLFAATVLVAMLAAAAWQERRLRRFAADPAYEATLNHRAIQWLRAHDDFDRIKLPGEIPRESVDLRGWRPRWLLVTNRRVLLFAASARERRLASEWPRRAVLFAGPPEQLPGRRAAARWLRLPAGANLGLALTGGTSLQLRCASAVTAARVAQLLMASPAPPEERHAGPARRGPALLPRRRWREVLASLLVPGTGQWLQGRFATGAVLFTAAVLLSVFVVWPVLWALQGPKMEVSGASVASASVVWALLALAAGSDAWRFSATREPRRGR